MTQFLSSPRGRADWLFAEDVPSAVTVGECEQLVELARGAAVLEVGSFYGRSTIALASVAEVVHSVDPHLGGPDSTSTLQTFLENLERYGVRDKVVVHVALSTELLPLLREVTFDLVFVDAMHQRPEVDVDFAVAAPTLRPEGAIAFHDYGLDGVQVGDLWHPFDVTQAVDRIALVPGVVLSDVADTLAVLKLEPAVDGAAPRTWEDVSASPATPTP